MAPDAEVQNTTTDPLPLHKALSLAERYHSDGHFMEADALCRRVLEGQPSNHAAEHLLGLISYKTGKLSEAIERLRRAITLAPGIALYHANLGELWQLEGRMDEAAAAANRALALQPAFAQPLNSLGRIALARGDAQKALDYCQRALALNPRFADAHNDLGNIRKELGQIDAAENAYLSAIECAPNTMGFYVNFADVHRFTPGDPHLAALQALESKTLSQSNRLQLDFALAKAYDDLKDYRRSFQHLLAGNAGKRAQIKYDEKSALALFDHIAHVFTAEFIEERSGGGDRSPVPIFIVGMPRSGTTLAEQILASHPEVHGAGELTALHEIVSDTPAPDGRPIGGPRVLPLLEAKTFAEMGARYVEAVRSVAPRKSRVVDKMPFNFYFMGLIHLILPEAKIIHMTRDPADTCFSCFSKLFSLAETGKLNHTYDLGELGRYYKRYAGLMTHWRHVLPPGRILEVCYEDLVADLNGQAKRMIAYCGLPWDERCLAFHQTERQIRTVSAVQVRQPIYQSSIGRWRAYKEFLGPLLTEL